MRPVFVTVEGIDGTGKTTQITLLKSAFEQAGAKVHLTKIPGDLVQVGADLVHVGSNIGAKIRHLLFKEPTTHNLAPGVGDLLFLADTLQCQEMDIKPALKRGETVISDRFFESQFAYMVEKTTPPWAKRLWHERYHFLPDVTILLTINPELGLSRSKNRTNHEAGKQEGKAWNSIRAQLNIQNAYLAMLAGKPRTVLVEVIPGKDIDHVFGEIWQGIERRVKQLQSEPERQMEFEINEAGV